MKSESEVRALTARLRWLYDDYRKALLNRKYYGYRLDFYLKVNSASDYIVMFGTSGTIAGASYWKTRFGTICWSLLGTIVAVLTIVRKAGNLSKKIEKYSKLYSEYNNLFYDLQSIVKEVHALRGVSSEMAARLGNATKRIRDLAADDDPKPSERLRRRCFEEVNREIPVRTLWYPEEERT